MNWIALGYDGDPAFRGGRVATRLVAEKEGQR